MDFIACFYFPWLLLTVATQVASSSNTKYTFTKKQSFQHFPAILKTQIQIYKYLFNSTIIFIKVKFKQFTIRCKWSLSILQPNCNKPSQTNICICVTIISLFGKRMFHSYSYDYIGQFLGLTILSLKTSSLQIYNIWDKRRPISVEVVCQTYFMPPMLQISDFGMSD